MQFYIEKHHWHLLISQVYVVKNGEILELIKDELKQYKGYIKLKVIADKEEYKFYYSGKGLKGKGFRSEL